MDENTSVNTQKQPPNTEENVRQTDSEMEVSATSTQNNVKVISPGRMVLKRFFRSKLSIVSLSFLVFLFLFSFLGPLFTPWGESEPDPRPGAPVILQLESPPARVRVTGDNLERLLIQRLDGKPGVSAADIENAIEALRNPTSANAGNRLTANAYNLSRLAVHYGENSNQGFGIFSWPSAIPGGEPSPTPFTVVTRGPGQHHVYIGALDENGAFSIIVTSQILHSYSVRERNVNARPNWRGDRSQPLGTDSSGYDILTRLMYGGRISLTIGFVSVTITLLLGLLFGGLAGYFGGWVDNLVMRVVDTLSCLPGLPILLMMSAILDGMPNIPPQFRIYLLMGMLALIGWHGTARLVRGMIFSLREQEFMVATEALGLPVSRRIIKHLIPNIMPLLIVSAVTALGGVILMEAGLSFLGVGVRPPAAAWGLMIASVRDPQIMIRYPNQWIPAGVLIVMAILAFGFLGDSLRDAFDPKAKR